MILAEISMFISLFLCSVHVQFFSSENSDLFDVLEYVAYAKPPVSNDPRDWTR